jgi:1-acyl-sn-glycerol-3-phosphate acyltransferase
LLFGLIKIPAQLALRIYCRDIKINHKELLESHGPLIIAANHPNSFLDAIIIATLFKEPVYSLARGDAFTNNFVSKILGLLNMLPVYRISEGQENLENNYQTFDSCVDIFRRKGIVLIFSEGLCENEWHLRPLKKGTARIAISSWDNGIPLKILPLGINYNSFQKFGKNVQMNFGNIISAENFLQTDTFGNKVNSFNAVLQNELEKLVTEIKPYDDKKIREAFHVPNSTIKKILLAIPAMAGYITHILFYFPIKFIVKNIFSRDVHYDSIMVSLFFLLYPFYLLAACLLTHHIFGCCWWLLTFLCMPFSAWSYVQLKKQF